MRNDDFDDGLGWIVYVLRAYVSLCLFMFDSTGINLRMYLPVMLDEFHSSFGGCIL